MPSGVMQRGASTRRYRLLCTVALYAMAINSLAPLAAAASQSSDNDAKTTTPIKHVIVIIGENRTFDHIFATYQPKNKDETVWNLLSRGIVNKDGSPGWNYYQAALQYSAQDRHRYSIHPGGKRPFAALPTPLAGGATTAPFSSISDAMAAENGLAPDYYQFLTTGGTGLKSGAPDTRISYDGYPVTNLPPGPFQLTPGVPYDAYAASPVHRFYQMWQQLDCTAAAGLPRRPLPVGRSHYRRRQQRQAAAGELRLCRRRHLDGLLQYAAGRRAVSQIARRPVFDERQLPPGGHRRDRGQSHHARRRHGDLVQRRQRQPGGAAAQPGRGRRRPKPGRRRRGRKPQPAARRQQLVHRGRLWRRLLRLALLRRRQLQRVRRHLAARRAPDRRLSAIIAAAGQPELPARSLLPAEQLQSGLLRRRQQRLCPDRQRRTTRCSRFRRRGSGTSATCC